MKQFRIGAEAEGPASPEALTGSPRRPRRPSRVAAGRGRGAAAGLGVTLLLPAPSPWLCGPLGVLCSGPSILL